VLERKEEVGGRICCTGIVSQNCLDAFNIDSGLIQRRVNSARVYSPSGKQINLWRKKNQAAIIDRGQFDKYMAERAQSAGAEYLFNKKVIDLTIESDHISVKTSSHDRRLEFKSRAAVIAVGFGSNLIKKLGLAPPTDFVIGAQIEVGTDRYSEIEVFTGNKVAPGFFAWLVPTLPHRGIAGLLSRQSPKEHLGKLLSFLESVGKINYNEGEITCRGITIKPLTKTYGQRFLVVGDAAGQVKPTTGGGIYFGLLSARIAARHLEKVLKEDNLSTKSMSSYQREWKKDLWQELKICYWGRKLFERLCDRNIDRIFEVTTANAIDRVLLEAEDISFDWHGKAILKFAREEAITRSIKAIKVPFKFVVSGRRDDR
jgi:geranylgeranyl reductase family protein